MCTRGNCQTITQSPASLSPRQYGEVNPSARSLRPILRWAGSKRKHLFRLIQFWGVQHSRYVEPFAGSACLFFEVAPFCAVLGDINEELIRFYEIVRASPGELHSRLHNLPRNPETFSRWRQKNPLSLDPKTRALRFLC